MSISLPNGAVVNLPREIAAPVSAAVTRILHLSNFNAELKTKDIVALFQEWAQDRGGYKIKWVDDTNVLIVFNDAHVAKRAYLSLVLNRPAVLALPAVIRPYDRPDAFKVIQQLNARTQGHGHRASLSTTLTSGNFANIVRDDAAGYGHARQPSAPTVPGASGGGFGGFKMPLAPGAAGGAGAAGAAVPGATHSLGARSRMSVGSLGAMSGAHQRTGSASSSWGRTSLSGALGFGAGPSASAHRLPTHAEAATSATSALPSRSTSGSSSGADPIVVLDAGSQLKSTAASLNGSRGPPRRESITADKALREVQKALRSVEAQG